MRFLLLFSKRGKMNKNLIGYGIAGVGLLGLLLSSKIGQAIVGSSLSSALLFPSLTITAAGIVILIVFSRYSSSSSSYKSSKGKEVPIYKGKEVVGYRVVD